jgi:hypothetical protein
MITDNNIEAELSRHNTVSIDRRVYDQGKEVSQENWYINNDEIYIESTSGYASVVNSESYLIANPGDNSLFIYLSSDPNVYKAWLNSTKVEYSLTGSSEEVLTSTEEKDGTFHAETLISTDSIVNELITAYQEAYATSTKYESGMKLKYTYDFNTASKDVTNVSTYIVDSDGKETLFITDRYSYEDTDFSDKKKSGSLAPAYDENNQRTLKVTFGTGTDNAFTREYKLTDNMTFVIYHGGNYVKDIYTDEACTTPYNSSDTSVTELYIK